VELHADGSFEALVPLQVGKNVLEVRARSSRGDEASASVLVHYAPGSARTVLPAELLGKYNALLQRRVLALGAAQREKVRRELVLEIERERASALERAGAAVVVEESNLEAAYLVDTVAALLNDPYRLRSMSAAAKSLAHPKAVEEIAEMVKILAERN
jgi:hypothetical protein